MSYAFTRFIFRNFLKSWDRNWNELTTFFEYPPEILVLSIIVDTISQKIYKPANIYYSTYSLR